MALRHSWLCWKAAFVIWLLIFAMEPHGAYSSSRDFSRKTITVRTDDTPKGGQGICASAITVHGYKCDELYVTTKDGYIINVQRIPEGRNGGTGKRQPVILQHGVMCDAMSWFVNSPEQNLPTILADSGFDVWLPNTRGTRYSRQHTTLDPEEKDYWDWSWDELVAYELPAIFDHVHKQTGQKVHYIGHSMGTLTGLVSCSERTTVIDNIQSIALMSPIAYLSHMTTAIGNLAAKTLLGETLELLGVVEFNPGGEQVSKCVQSLCGNPGIDCYNLMSAITGKNCCLNSSTVEVFLKNYPQSSSTKNMFHLAQTARSGVLTKFDYATPLRNIDHYGAIHPPTYNLSDIPNHLPVFIGHGGKDALADTRDVAKLIDEDLKFHDKDKLSVLLIDEYGHQDFVMAVNAKEMVYNSIISFFNLHQQA